MAKEVRAINFDNGTEQHQQKSDISELGTRRVKIGSLGYALTMPVRYGV